MTELTRPQHTQRRFHWPISLWEVLFLGAFVAAIFAAAAWRSHKNYLNNDELLTAVLVANPDFSTMWKVISHGGELNPPLFFVLEWIVAHTVGTSDWALRLVAAVSVALAGVVLFFTIRPVTGARVAALAVAIVFGLSRDVFVFCSTARYYGLLLLLVSIAVFLALRFQQEPRRRDYILFFLTNCALVYLHLYGFAYSGAILAAMIAGDFLRRNARWGVYLSVVAAWVTFAAWVPSMRQQLRSVSGGVYTPPNMLDVGFFLEQLSLQTPLAPVLLLVVLLALLYLVSSRPASITEELNAPSNPMDLAAGALVALALLAVPLAAWTGSHFMHPPPYMARYNFPCIAAWVLIIGFVLFAAHRLPPPAASLRPGLPPSLWKAAWFGALAVCLVFQPIRARKSPDRPPGPFIEEDYGYKDLPIVFENSWYYLQRAWYGHDREYALLIDYDAAEADPGWYTKNMEREWKAFRPRYPKARILYFDELPDWPQGFLAVDDDTAKTFEWIFSHHPELKIQLLGTRKSDPEDFGQQRVYLVRKSKP